CARKWRAAIGRTASVTFDPTASVAFRRRCRPAPALLPLANAGGTLATYAVMANLKYDIPFGGLGLPLQPYIGTGLGYGWPRFNNAAGNGFGAVPLPGINNFFVGPEVVSFGTAVRSPIRRSSACPCRCRSYPALSRRW